DSDGWEYRFDANGALLSATNALDDRQPAALGYQWSGSPARLTTVTDPVSGRQITLHHGGDAACPTSPPTGLAAAPTGQLCRVVYWDGTDTKIWYHTPANGSQLARIEDPGGEITDFGYATAAGELRLARIRDPLAADAVAAGVRSDAAGCDTTCTVVAYDTPSGKALTVTGPEPTAGAARPRHRYEYLAGQTRLHRTEGAGEVLDRTVTYDGRGTRVLVDTDATGAPTTTIWDVADRTRATIDPAGRLSSTVYDTAGRVTDVYGPAPRPQGAVCAQRVLHQPAGAENPDPA
ncbi:MAG: PA14 domain-containing protein, partial [Acidimicrobiales bacterium]